MLAAWDGRADTGSRGEVLWRETWNLLTTAGVPWRVPFDPADPVNTPRDPDPASDKLTDALRGAVADLQSKGIALDAPLGELQAEPRGSERIGIPGCSENEGCFNIISTHRDAAGRYDPYTGSSFVMAAGFDAQGRPARLVDPVLLAVREPRLAALRRSDAAVLATSSGCRCASPRRRSSPTRSTRGGW